jgi:hypothetical protein
MWVQDGQRNRVVTDLIHFASPGRYVHLKNGAILTYVGQNPDAQTDGGWNADLNLPMDKATLDWAVGIIRQTFVCETNSYVGFGGGKVNEAGVTSATTKPAEVVQPSN